MVTRQWNEGSRPPCTSTIAARLLSLSSHHPSDLDVLDGDTHCSKISFVCNCFE